MGSMHGSAPVFWLAVLGSLAASVPAHAGAGVWTTSGPYAPYPINPCEDQRPGQVIGLVVDPSDSSTLYAVCDNRGVLRSSDSGASWVLATAGLSRANGVIVIDPASPATLYAGTGHGVFKSTNRGASWSPANTGIANLGIRALAIDPHTPSTLYAATSSGLFKSTDAGVSWANTSANLTPPSVTAVAVDPSTPATLYAATFQANGFYRTSGWVFKSTDAGATWQQTGSAELSSDRYASAIVIAAGAPSAVYLMANGGPYGGWLKKSTDGGASWLNADAGMGIYSDDLRAFVVDPSSPQTLYASTWGSLFKSTDSGASWTIASPDLVQLDVWGGQALALAASAPSKLYFVGYSFSATRIFTSSDAGVHWTAAATQPSRVTVEAMVVDPGTPATMYVAAGKSGVFKSSDGGRSWAAANAGLPPDGAVDVAIDPRTPSILYAAPYGEVGVYRSTDGGETWKAAGNAGLPPYARVSRVAIDPAVTTTLYALSSGNLYKSIDSGATWSTSETGLDQYAWPEMLVFDPVTFTLYLLDQWHGVYRSMDSGATWVAANTGMGGSLSLHALAIDPANPATLYAAGALLDPGIDGVLFKSSDAGATWAAIPAVGVLLSGDPATSLLVDPSVPSTIHLGTANGHVFRSTDSGNTWTSIGAGLPSQLRCCSGLVTSVSALAQSAAAPGTLFAGSSGVWQLGPRVASHFNTVAPCRIFDSRESALGGPAALSAGTTKRIAVAGRCGIPASAAAAALNVTVTSPSAPGYLTLVSDDVLRPTASTLNYATGQTRAASAVARLGASGALNVYVGQASGDVHVVIDVSGYLE